MEATMESEGLVTLIEPERMNLLGLMLRSIIERRLADPKIRQRTRWLKGYVAIKAGGMQVTLRFMDDGVEISRAPPREPPVVEVEGTLSALLGAALGQGRVRAWLAQELKVSGGPFSLLQLLTLMKAG